MRVLDLFCGCGGASVGYKHAWPNAEIIGVDIEPQPDYPFTFVQGDAVAFLGEYVERGTDRDGKLFDFIHASPPCQAFSTATPTDNDHPDLIRPTRSLLQGSHTTWVIENVPPAPLRRDLLLCGSMFGLQIQRHRVFETSPDLFFWNPPTCDHRWSEGRPWTVTGHGGGGKFAHSWKRRNLDHAKELMGMPWCDRIRGVTEAIPPAYTQFIGETVTRLQEGDGDG